MYSAPRSTKGSNVVVCGFLKAWIFCPQERMAYNILFNIVFPYIESRGHVFEKDRFIIYHVLQGRKINLPTLILDHWTTSFKTPIPCCILLQEWCVYLIFLLMKYHQMKKWWRMECIHSIEMHIVDEVEETLNHFASMRKEERLHKLKCNHSFLHPLIFHLRWNLII